MMPWASDSGATTHLGTGRTSLVEWHVC